MTLDKYNQKRDFDNTPEPAGGKNEGNSNLRFVVQRHQASTLHYDFRLELQGVLKSWAVPKGPSLDPGEKRLAMMVEDHPLGYRTFEGDIPEGNYGAGHVAIWDEGTYQAADAKNKAGSEQQLLNGLEKGSFSFVLEGSKLKGEFALVKLHGRQKDAWLLIKKNDEFAVEDYDAENHPEAPAPAKKPAGISQPETETESNSKSKKDTVKKDSADKAKNTEKPDPKPKKEAAKPKKAGGKAKAGDDDDDMDDEPETPAKKKAEAEMPRQVEPMTAKLTNAAFNDSEWIFETKYDGYRAIAEVEGKDVKLYSRSGKSFTERYQPIVKALAKLGRRAVLDGEVVATDSKGKASFQLLQNYLNKPTENLRYYIFDLLYLDGEDLREMPLVKRKEMLEELLPDSDKVIFYSEHTDGKGEALFKKAQKEGQEGIMAKKADSLYRTGKRSGDWLKVKTQLKQEAVIIGFSDKGSSEKGPALALGFFEKNKLKYAGLAEGGLDKKAFTALKKQMEPLARKEPAAGEAAKIAGNFTWLEPELVAEISFAEWTAEGQMSKAVFEGIREDKPAKDVVREKPEGNDASLEMDIPADLPDLDDEEEEVVVKAPVRKAKKGAKTPVRTVPVEEEEVMIGRHRLKLTNQSKVFWPEEGYTKGDVIAYYRSISKYILPYLVDRPQSLLRHPNGITSPGFFQKDVNNAPEWIQTESILAESTQENVDYLIIQNEASLAYANNLGCIQLNPWNSRITSLDYPDYIVIDLDPGDNTFDQVIEVALAAKDVLDRAGVESYVKTSGATGMHIFVPLGARYDFDQAKDFSHALADEIHYEIEDITSLERSPKARRKLIYIDFLQNAIGQTIAAPYSLRARPGAPVSMPLQWKEVKKGLHPSQFNIKNALTRIEKMGDLFEGVLGTGIDLKKAMDNLGA